MTNMTNIGSYCEQNGVTFLCLRSVNMYDNGFNYGVVMSEKLKTNLDLIINSFSEYWGNIPNQICE